MRHLRRAGILIAATLLTAFGWIVWAQGPVIVAPFTSTPAFSAIFFSNFIKGATILARKIDGTYMQLQYLRTPPYYFGDLMSVPTYLSGGVANLLAAPAGPAGVGLAGGIVAAGKFTAAGDPGVASLSLIRNRNAVSVHSATLAGVYSGASLYPVGMNVSAVVAGDFSGDGVADLAVTYSGNFSSIPGGVGILINKGDGTFNPSVSLPAGSQPNGLTMFDLNRDNKLDLVVTESADTGIYVLLGNGNGSFAAPVPYAVAYSWAVTVADFNKDGSPDLAVSAINSLNILLGAGNGTFQTPTSIPTGSTARFLAAGDFNNDGKMDLGLVNTKRQTVSIMIGNGSGGFVKSSEYIASYGVASMVVTDYNTDGKLDILVGQGDSRIIGPDYNSQSIDILLGRGDGTFTGAYSNSFGDAGFGSTKFLTTGDINGDGILDVITHDFYRSQILILNGKPDASFAPPTIITLPGSGQLLPSSAVAGDFNGDGRTDLAVTEETPGLVAILLNSGGTLQTPTTFSSGGTKPKDIAAADFDGDGKLDLAVANNSGKTSVFRGGGNGAFQLLATYSTGSFPVHVIAEDMNGDRQPDLIVTDFGSQYVVSPVQGAVYLMLNTGGGTFQNPVAVPGPSYPNSVTAGDANGDGKKDLIVSGDKGPGFVVSLAFGNGDGTFQPATFLTTDFNPTSAAVRDFSGDGKMDIVVTHCCGSTDMTYFQGTGPGTFAPEVHFNGGASPIDVKVSDLDGNGTPDVLIAGNDGSITALLNSSASTNGPPRLDVLSGASYALDGPLAPLAIAVGFGTGLSAENAVGTSPWPTTLAGTSVVVKDQLGSERAAPLIYAFPNQISFLIPPGTTAGIATVDVNRNGGTVARGTVTVASISPGLITANSNGQGVAAAVAVRATREGTQTSDLIFTCPTAGNCTATPIDLSTADVVVLTLYGTGIRGRASLAGVTAQAGTTNLDVLYAGAQGQYDGLDQVNVDLPPSLAGRGLITLTLMVDGKKANPVQFRVK